MSVFNTIRKIIILEPHGFSKRLAGFFLYVSNTTRKKEGYFVSTRFNLRITSRQTTKELTVLFMDVT